MKNLERMLWIGVATLALVFAFWEHFYDQPPGTDAPADSKGMVIEARCGVAAGGALSSSEVAIACGLDEAGVEAVIAQAIGEFNLEELAGKLQQGEQSELPVALDRLAIRLGITREAVVDLLRKQDTGVPSESVTPGRLAKTLVQGQPHLAINVTSTIAKKPHEETPAQGASAVVSPPQDKMAAGIAEKRETTTGPAVAPENIIEESRKLQVDCGVVAGEGVEVGVTRISCGPDEEDVDAIIRRLVAEADIDKLIADLRQGRLAQTKLLDTLGKELSISRSTVLSLLNQTANHPTDAVDAASHFQAMAKDHVELTYRIGQLPIDNAQSRQLRDLAAAAIAAGNYPMARTLLRQGSELRKSEGALAAAQDEIASLKQQLAEMNRQRESAARKHAQEEREEPAQAAKETQPPDVVEPDAETESDPPRLFLSGDKALLKSPTQASAGSVMTFEWQGPAAPDDLIFHAPLDQAENSYPTSDRHRHRASKGSPAVLIAPATPGDYEIRYFSYANGKPLARVPLKVTDPVVHLGARHSVVAGTVMEFEWHGPNAPDDMLFITEPTANQSQYFTTDRRRYKTGSGSPAKLVAPAKRGTHEVRYYSYNNGSVLFSQPLEVSAPEVQFAAPETVNSGAHMQFTWEGPNAPGDMIFIAKPDLTANQYYTSNRRRHLTREGRTADLVAPADPGEYEIRYFSHANGTVLSSVPLTVE